MLPMVPGPTTRRPLRTGPLSPMGLVPIQPIGPVQEPCEQSELLAFNGPRNTGYHGASACVYRIEDFIAELHAA